MIFSQFEELYKRFIEQEMSVDELKSRLQTLIVPDNHSKQIQALLISTDNKLEELLFSRLECNHKKYALEILDELRGCIKRIE